MASRVRRSLRDNMKKRSGFYMIGTRALHKLGDISRDGGDLCIIFGKMRGYYIGNWITGLGFVDVKFPIATTRHLSREDKRRYNGKRIALGSSYWYTLKV